MHASDRKHPAALRGMPSDGHFDAKAYARFAHLTTETLFQGKWQGSRALCVTAWSCPNRTTRTRDTGCLEKSSHSNTEKV